MLANPLAGSVEFEIPDNFLIRVPFPLVPTLQDYKRGIELYFNKRDHFFSSSDLRQRVFDAEAKKRGQSWQRDSTTNASNATLSSR